MYMDRNTVVTRKRNYEKIDSKSITEQSGYIPPDRQIQDMMNAGRRLQEYRMSQYDFASPDDIDESLSDPTRSANFDLADATQMAMSADEAIKKAELAAAQEAKIASQTAQEGSGEPEPVKGA